MEKSVDIDGSREGASADLNGMRSRRSVMDDLSNPQAYLAAAFPRPQKEASTLTPTVDETPAKRPGEAIPPAAIPSAVKEETDRYLAPQVSPRAFAEETGDGTAGRSAAQNDDDEDRSRRASRVLAEMKSAAEQRGLLKGAGSGSCSESKGNGKGIVVGKLLPPNRRADSADSLPSSEQKVEVAEHSGTAQTEQGAGRHSSEWIDQSRQQRMEILLDWLISSIGMQEVFLIDARGYSLFPDTSTDGDKAAGSSATSAAALQDLGLRLGGVLDLASRRLEKSGGGGGANENRVARLSMPGGQNLAVAKLVAPASQADAAVLGWLEAAGSPIPVTWVESACEYVGEVLALDHSS